MMEAVNSLISRITCGAGAALSRSRAAWCSARARRAARLGSRLPGRSVRMILALAMVRRVIDDILRLLELGPLALCERLDVVPVHRARADEHEHEREYAHRSHEGPRGPRLIQDDDTNEDAGEHGGESRVRRDEHHAPVLVPAVGEDGVHPIHRDCRNGHRDDRKGRHEFTYEFTF